MKDESIAFSVIPVNATNRFEDRVSFLYLEYSRIIQNDFGVVALSKEPTGQLVEKQIPVAQIATLFLGPGTSISTPAIISASRSGCTVLFSGGQGYPLNSRATALTNSGRWAVAQAIVVANKSKARAVAKEFYLKQFRGNDFEGSISQMRALEGSLIKKVYAREAARNGIGFFRRDSAGEDNVNIALNIANTLLYGLSASAVASFAMSESLGVIHRGNAKSFLFDLADLYKIEISIPIAFSAADIDKEQIPTFVRQRMRQDIGRRKLMKELSSFITETFRPYLPENFDDRLISGSGPDVAGHKNYGDK